MMRIIKLEESGFEIPEIKETVIEIYKYSDTKASSWVELPEKFKNSQPNINKKHEGQLCFYGVSRPIFTRLSNLKIEHQII